MQHAQLVDVLDRVENLDEVAFDKIRAQAVGIFLKNFQKIAALHVIQCHIGGVVFLEDLMHADDVRVVRLGKGHRFLTEQAHNGFQLILMSARARCHRRVLPAAEAARETLLDDNPASQTILCKISDAESARREEILDRILPEHQFRVRLQFVDEFFVFNFQSAVFPAHSLALT